MTVDASPSPEPGREGSLGDAFLPSGLRRIERSPAGGQSRQTAAGQSTGLSGAPPAVGIPNTPPGPRHLHRSVSPHGCAMRHTPPREHAVLIPPRDDRSHQSPRPRCAAHAYRTPDERGREADPGRGRRRGRPGATGGTLLLLLRPWSSLSASPGLASSPGGSIHSFLPVGSEGSHLSGGYRGRHRPRHQILRQQEAAAQTCGIWDALPPTLKGAARFPFDSQHQMTPARVFSADPVA